MTTKRKVLLVEDNQILAENYKRIIKDEFKVYIAATADEALDKIDEKAPDFLVLDVLLGKHSVFALLNELQSYASTFSLPSIICSDVANNLQLSELAPLGVKEIIDKSTMQPRDILKALRRLDSAV